MKKFDFTIKIIGRIRDQYYYNSVMKIIPPTLKKLIIIEKFMLPVDVANEMSNSSMLVQTSLNETAPMVIAEAMTVGLPVIAADVGGVIHMINHEKNGFIIKSGSEQELLINLNKLLNDRMLRKEIGDRAKKFCKKYIRCKNNCRKNFKRIQHNFK